MKQTTKKFLPKLLSVILVIHLFRHFTGNSSDHDVSTDDSDGTIFDKGNDPDKVATKNIGYSEEDPRISGGVSSPRPGSVRGFVENWKDVELHDTILSPEQVGCMYCLNGSFLFLFLILSSVCFS